MSNWEGDDDEYCTTAADFQDARRVCDALDIPLHRVSFAGRVSRPGICPFLARVRRRAHAKSGRAVQSGNQIRRVPRLHAPPRRIEHRHRALRATAPLRPGTLLMKAADASKDQSYFLHGVEPSALRQDPVPVGRAAQGRGPPARPRGGPGGVRQAGQHRHLLHRRAPIPGVLEPLHQHRGRARSKMPRATSSASIAGLRSTPSANARASAWAAEPGRPRRPGTSPIKDLPRNALIVVQEHDHPLLMSRALRGRGDAVAERAAGARRRRAVSIAR